VLEASCEDFTTEVKGKRALAGISAVFFFLVVLVLDPVVAPAVADLAARRALKKALAS
jgi:hypothetical protein